MRFWEIQAAILNEQVSYSYSDTRRPRLTLRHLHALRRLRDRQAIDRHQHSQFVSHMYNYSYEDQESESTTEGCFDGDNAKQALRSIKADQKEQEKTAQKAMNSIKTKNESFMERYDLIASDARMLHIDLTQKN